MARRGLVCLAAIVLALITAPPGVARPTLDDGKSGPGARWDPGMLLVKLRPGIAPSHRRRMLRRLGLRQVDRLPLVPDVFEVRVPPGSRVRTAQRKLRRRTEVLYTQPDWHHLHSPHVGPSDRSYWPDDPLFWPSTFKQPNGCEDHNALEQWPLWQLGQNLTDSGDPAHKFNPLVSGRSEVSGGLVEYDRYHSINVLPVWSVLRDQGRLSGRSPGTAWQTEDIQRSGIAVQDTGLSSAPDIVPQVAALFSTVSSNESAGDRTMRDRIRQVYRDNPARKDLEPVQRALEGKRIDFDFTNRALFALDDTDTFEQPVTSSEPDRPTGCDGHGTAVASVAAAKANNAIGVAGVAYDVPLIGLRAGAWWDRPPDKEQAQDEPESLAAYTTENAIHQLQIVKALQVPVLNMSYGKPLFEAAGQADAPPVVKDPLWADALLRTLATGKTLGVATAGNNEQQYGIRPARNAQLGTGERAPRAPCGINLIRVKGALVPGGKTFSANSFPGKTGRPDWGDVNLLCVAASSRYASRLAEFSGWGDAAVDLAAPGQGITALARPLVGGTAPAYQVVSGTSVAAPMVAGAAALLREAAPGAPIEEIARALRSGARMNPPLDEFVRDGSLDVACALRALERRSKADWDLVALDDPHFANATRDCGGKPRYVEEKIHAVDAEYLRAQPTTTLTELIGAKQLSPAPSVSMSWQQRLLGKQSAPRVVFGRSGNQVDPAKVTDAVYDAGPASIGCTAPGYTTTRVNVSVMGDDGAPQLWYFPTDAASRRDPIEVALALARPLPRKAKSLSIRLRAYCDQFPSIPR